MILVPIEEDHVAVVHLLLSRFKAYKTTDETRTCLSVISRFAERKQTPRKQNTHRAMDDIKESIAELKYYKDNIFKPQKSKR